MFEIFSGVPKPVGVVIALALVLALIGLIAWIVRRVAAGRLGSGALRGRQPRLAVIDAANVDARRKLILIRRDNIEHLLMIGGPSDIVVESNIVRAGGARESAREPSRLELGGRPAGDNGWPLQPVNEPPRGRDESWSAPEPVPPARGRASETPAAPSPDVSPRIASPDLSPRREPRTAPASPAAPVDASGNHNLAEMAEQLEAALRGSVAEPRAPSLSPPVQPLAMPREVKMRIDPRIDRGDAKREVRSEPRIDKPDLKLAAAEPKPEFRAEPRPDLRLAPEPRIEAKSEPKMEPRVEPKVETKPEPKPESRIEAKSEPKLDVKADPQSRQDFYDNLEEEMASLLGRPPGKP